MLAEKCQLRVTAGKDIFLPLQSLTHLNANSSWLADAPKQAAHSLTLLCFMKSLPIPLEYTSTVSAFLNCGVSIPYREFDWYQWQEYSHLKGIIFEIELGFMLRKGSRRDNNCRRNEAPHVKYQAQKQGKGRCWMERWLFQLYFIPEMLCALD